MCTRMCCGFFLALVSRFALLRSCSSFLITGLHSTDESSAESPQPTTGLEPRRG